MTFVPTGYAKCTAQFRLPMKNDPVSITWGVKNEGVVAGLPADADGVAQLAYDCLQTKIALFPQYMSQGVTFLGVIAELGDGAGTGEVGQHMDPISGTVNNANNITQSETILIAKVTGRRGRAFSGRMYMPFVAMTENNVNERGIIGAQLLTDEQNRWSLFWTNLGEAGIPMYLLHGDDAIDPTLVTGLVVRSRIGTQRRRLN